MVGIVADWFTWSNGPDFEPYVRFGRHDGTEPNTLSVHGRAVDTVVQASCFFETSTTYQSTESGLQLQNLELMTRWLHRYRIQGPRVFPSFPIYIASLWLDCDKDPATVQDADLDEPMVHAHLYLRFLDKNRDREPRDILVQLLQPALLF
jgi:hypothetical protein